MNNPRPDPDQLLARIHTEENRHNHGRLKVFLGYAAGVGKTFAMLEAAHQRKEGGLDVVVGVIETHGRVETEHLLIGLEVLPRKQIYYRSVSLSELDLDAVLSRAPQLVLVDELAHTNAPGSRHTKRYQDVEELLAAGIDVYTTLNIQHLESLNDVIAQITGVTVRETVPDSIIDSATEIELVDLPPDELLNRLNEGKVYVPEQASRAIQKFFRKGNLTALRELSMRRAAERVDDQMRAYMQTQAIPGPWPAAERLLVCISPSPLAERLVRSTRRLADELNAEWLAIYVETPAHARLTDDQRTRISKNLILAEELGARSITLPGIPFQTSFWQYAREHNVTKIIVGKPLRPRWREISVWFGGRSAGPHQRQNRCIYYQRDRSPAIAPRSAEIRPHRPGCATFMQFLICYGATAITVLFHTRISPTNLVMIYLLLSLLPRLSWPGSFDPGVLPERAWL